MSTKATQKLVQERPKLAQALAGHEIRLRLQLRAAREQQDLPRWKVAELLGWSIRKVAAIESMEADIKFSEMRAYLLAIGCYVEFTIHSDKKLG